MCVKRESFRHKGISVPLGRLPGFAVITVPSRRKGEKRLWLDCRQIWTLIKLPSANTGIPSSFSARSKRVVCRVWCFFFVVLFFSLVWGLFLLGISCRVIYLIIYLSCPQRKASEGPAFLGKSLPQPQSASDTELGCSLRSLAGGIVPSEPAPSLPPHLLLLPLLPLPTPQV